MEIIYPTTLFTSLKNKHLLLDSNIFRDFAMSPEKFSEFFNKLKSNDVTLCGLDVVKFEMLKGSQSLDKYKSRDKFLADILDDILVPDIELNNNVYSLIQEFGERGSAISLTDLYLGAALKRYKQNIYLMTRDTSDFVQNIFDLKFIVNATHTRGIFTYGIYQYPSK